MTVVLLLNDRHVVESYNSRMSIDLSVPSTPVGRWINDFLLRPYAARNVHRHKQWLPARRSCTLMITL